MQAPRIPTTRKRARRLALFTAVAAVALPTAAQADITINVRDVSGAPAAGVVVTTVAGQNHSYASSYNVATSDANGTLVLKSANLAGAKPPYTIGLRPPYTSCAPGMQLTGLRNGSTTTVTPYGLGASLCPPYSTTDGIAIALGAPSSVHGNAGTTADVKVAFPADAASNAGLFVNGAPVSDTKSYVSGAATLKLTLPAAGGPLEARYFDSAGAPHTFIVASLSIGGTSPVKLNNKLPRAFEFVIDNSGSMSSSDPTNQRYSAIANLVQAGCIRSADLVGAVGFDTDPYPLFTPVRRATGATLPSFLRALKAGIVDNGGTDYNVAFGQAQNAFGPVSANRAIQPIVFFLTDGDHNVGAYDNGHRFFGSTGRAPIYSIGLGTSISSSGKALLKRIAKETGGRYLNPQSSQELVASLSSLCNAATGGTTLTFATRTFAKKNSTRTVSIKIRKKTATKFQVAWGNGRKARFQISVIDPKRVVHTLHKPGKHVKAKVTASSAQLVFAKPLKGKYKLVLKAIKVQDRTQRGTAIVTVGGR